MNTTGDVVIRTATVDDVERYRDLRLEGLRLHPEAFGSDYDVARAEPPGYWLDRLASANPPTRAVYVADAGEDLVGMMVVNFNNQPKMRHVGWITGVYIRPAWRRRGLADMLFDACFAWAREQNLRLLKLAVATANAPAIGCYLRAGFTVFGVDPDALLVDGRYYDELMMSKRLER